MLGNTNISFSDLRNICTNTPNGPISINDYYVRLLCQASNTGIVYLSNAANRPTPGSNTTVTPGSYTFYVPVNQNLTVVCSAAGGSIYGSGSLNSNNAMAVGGNSSFNSTIPLVAIGGGAANGNNGYLGSNGSFSGPSGTTGVPGGGGIGRGIGGDQRVQVSPQGGHGGIANITFINGVTNSCPVWANSYNYVVGIGGRYGANYGDFPTYDGANGYVQFNWY